jgi:hypothetical protein
MSFALLCGSCYKVSRPEFISPALGLEKANASTHFGVPDRSRFKSAFNRRLYGSGRCSPPSKSDDGHPAVIRPVGWNWPSRSSFALAPLSWQPPPEPRSRRQTRAESPHDLLDWVRTPEFRCRPRWALTPRIDLRAAGHLQRLDTHEGFPAIMGMARCHAR